MLTGVIEKAVKANGIFAIFVGLKANAAKQGVVAGCTVENGGFCAAQIHKIQCRTAHNKQCVIGIGRIGAGKIGQVPTLGIHTELAHACQLPLIVGGLISQQLYPKGNAARGRAKR